MVLANDACENSPWKLKQKMGYRPCPGSAERQRAHAAGVADHGPRRRHADSDADSGSDGHHPDADAASRA